MKKPTMIIRKNHIILACLTLILGIAIYLSYAFTQAGEELTATDAMNSDSGTNYGDAEFVNAGDSTDYFAQARLDKITKRDEAVQTLQTMLGGGDITDEEKASLTQDAVNVAKLIESEGVVENLIKAQGFQDCVVYLDGKSANIVVKTEGLVPSEAAQIKDILLGVVSVSAENIEIFEVK